MKRYLDVVTSGIHQLNATSLKVGGNHISQEGAKRFFQSLKPSLKEIEFQNNKIGFQGIY